MDLQLEGLKKRLSDRQLTLAVSDEAKDFITDSAYDPVYGARPVKRFIQSNLETMVARAILNDSFEPGDSVNIGVKDGKLVIE